MSFMRSTNTNGNGHKHWVQKQNSHRQMLVAVPVLRPSISQPMISWTLQCSLVLESHLSSAADLTSQLPWSASLYCKITDTIRFRRHYCKQNSVCPSVSHTHASHPVLRSISNTSIWNTYLKYIHAFCIWNTFWKCILYLYLKYILMYLYFIFKQKNTKYILMRKYDVIALISKHILSCLPWFLPVLPMWPCAGWVRLHNYRIDCIVLVRWPVAQSLRCANQSPHQMNDVGWSTWELFE